MFDQSSQKMGCCCAQMSDVEAFLVHHVEGQPSDHLIPALPAALKMDDWQRLTPDFVSTGVSDAGTGEEHTLTVTDAGGNMVSRLHMPRYASFGVGATMFVHQVRGCARHTLSGSCPSRPPRTASSTVGHGKPANGHLAQMVRFYGPP